MDIKERLETLGCRLEGDFTLHSRKKSNVKWNISKLFENYSLHERLFYLRPWHKQILRFIRGRDILIVGIATSGYSLGYEFAGFYGLRWAHPQYHLSLKSKRGEALIMDDVLTTGLTVEELFYRVHTLGVAVLVNRSKMTKFHTVPIISGFYADLVE